MRTNVRITRFNALGVVTSIEEKFAKVEDLPDATALTLGLMGLKHLTLKFEDRQVRYSAIEYECELCGEYDHDGSNCPNFGDDPGDVPEA